nr:unnamed protein product [Ipomoea batatas]
MPLLPSVRTNRPGLMIFKTADVVLVKAVSLLPIHTTVGTGICLYHIPMYRFMEPAGLLKNPISKLPPDEMMVSPSLRNWVEVIPWHYSWPVTKYPPELHGLAEQYQLGNRNSAKRNSPVRTIGPVDDLQDRLMLCYVKVFSVANPYQLLATGICLYPIPMSSVYGAGRLLNKPHFKAPHGRRNDSVSPPAEELGGK